jgi:hypothetical protein
MTRPDFDCRRCRPANRQIETNRDLRRFNVNNLRYVKELIIPARSYTLIQRPELSIQILSVKWLDGELSWQYFLLHADKSFVPPKGGPATAISNLPAISRITLRRRTP